MRKLQSLATYSLYALLLIIRVNEHPRTSPREHCPADDDNDDDDEDDDDVTAAAAAAAAETSSETINVHGINGMVMNLVNSLFYLRFSLPPGTSVFLLFSLLSARAGLECIN